MEKAFSKIELENFESWRGILATVVVITHVLQIFYFPVYANDVFFAVVSGVANFAVIAFFILSGMLISLSIQNLTKDNIFNWKQYLINRFFRIYPGLIVTLIICILLRYTLPYLNAGSIEIFHIAGEKNLPRSNYGISLNQIFRTIFMLQPGIINVDGPLWSLFIEWWVYVSAMLLSLCLISNNKLKKVIFLIASFLVILLSMLGYGKYALFFVIIWYSGYFYTISVNKSLIRNIFLVAAIVLLVAAVLLGGISVFNINVANKFNWGLIQLSVGFLSFGLLNKGIPTNIFKPIAKYSYTLYIIHFPIMLFVFFIARKYIAGNIALIIATSITSFILAMIVSRLLSKYSERRYSFQTKRPKAEDVKISLHTI